MISQARRLDAELPIIIITGYSTEASAIEAVNNRRVRVSHQAVQSTESARGRREGAGRVGTPADLAAPASRPPPPSIAMIQLSAIGKAFGARVLFNNVTWQLRAGERIGLCGPNGAGRPPS